jgi:hypothetical protein
MTIKEETKFLIILNSSDKMLEIKLFLESLRKFRKDFLNMNNQSRTILIIILKVQNLFKEFKHFFKIKILFLKLKVFRFNLSLIYFIQFLLINKLSAMANKIFLEISKIFSKSKNLIPFQLVAINNGLLIFKTLKKILIFLMIKIFLKLKLLNKDKIVSLM